MLPPIKLRRRPPPVGFSWGNAIIRSVIIAVAALAAAIHFRESVRTFAQLRIDADIVGFTMITFWLIVAQRLIWERLNAKRLTDGLAVSRSILHDLGEPPDTEASKRQADRGSQLWDLGMIQEAASAFASAADLDSGNFDAIGRAGLVELSSGHVGAAHRYAQMLPAEPVGHGAGDLLRIRLARRENDRIYVRRTLHAAQEQAARNLRLTRWLVQYASEAAPWEWPMDVAIPEEWSPASPLEEACYAELLFRVGDRFEAIRRIKELTDRYPDHGGICLTAARLYSLHEDEGPCILELRRGIAENPLNVPLKQTLLTHLKDTDAKEKGALAHEILKLQSTNRHALVNAIASDFTNVHWIRGFVLYSRLKKLRKDERPGIHTASGWQSTTREDRRVWRQ
jgi:tetratricopeptide (TPR) repeat protein